MEQTHTTGTEVSGAPHGEHHDVGFPPFNSATFGSQLLWLVITFGLLYVMMSKLIVPRVASILEVRRDRIATDLNEAQRLKEEADAAMAAYEKALAEARAKAQTIATETRDRVAADAEAQRKVLEGELAEKMAAAERQIGETKRAAMTNVRGIAVEAADAIVQQIMGKPSPASDVEAAVDTVLEAA